jgi:hypothetical protein
MEGQFGQHLLLAFLSQRSKTLQDPKCQNDSHLGVLGIYLLCTFPTCESVFEFNDILLAHSLHHEAYFGHNMFPFENIQFFSSQKQFLFKTWSHI